MNTAILERLRASSSRLARLANPDTSAPEAARPPVSAEPEQPLSEPTIKLAPNIEPQKIEKPTHRSLPEAGNSVDDWRAWHRTLDPQIPPTSVPVFAWVAYITEAETLINQWGDKAEALGWTFADLFCADPRAPYARVDRQGLAWFLPEGEVMTMTTAAAAIKRKSGALQTYRRKL
jgi:hypothetical protein